MVEVLEADRVVAFDQSACGLVGVVATDLRLTLTRSREQDHGLAPPVLPRLRLATLRCARRTACPAARLARGPRISSPSLVAANIVIPRSTPTVRPVAASGRAGTSLRLIATYQRPLRRAIRASHSAAPAGIRRC